MNLKEIKRIAEGRTKGKWETETYGMQDFIISPFLNPFLYYGPEKAIVPMSGLREKDAEFIAMASNKFDKLLAVVEQVQQERMAHKLFCRTSVCEICDSADDIGKALKALEAEE